MSVLLRNVIMAGALALSAAWAAPCAAGSDEDPEVGEFRLQSLTLRETRGRIAVGGRLRATDDFGTTRDRDFRVEASGSLARNDRRVLLLRREPECTRLAAFARMRADDFCDRLALSRDRGRATLAFSSYDANLRYAFDLVERGSGSWQSQPAPGTRAPILSVQVSDAGDAVSYRIAIEGARQSYHQSGTISDEQLRGTGLDAFEASVVPIGDVLRSFNSWEFELADRPRDDPSYEPTPYLGWEERPVDGGCILVFCFGDLGGGGGSGGNNNQNVCDPRSDIYDPEQCPWDLTYATWPASQRVKIWKLDNDQVGYSFFVRNDENGNFHGSESASGFSDLVTFVSLIQLGSSQPLVQPGAPNPYGNDCVVTESLASFGVIDPFANTTEFSIPANTSVHTSRWQMLCPRWSGRPPGRYRLYVRIDPSDAYDYPGNGGNNVGDSGPLDWVNLKR